MWTIMVAAKLDHSGVLVTKFRQNRSMLKGRSSGQRHTDKPVGFYGPIAPQFRMPPSFDRCTPPRRRFNQNILPSVVLLQQCQCQCRNRHRGKLQNLSPPSVLFESSQFFAIHRRHRRKKDGPEFWNSNSVIFENFLKFSKRRRAVHLRPIWIIMVAAKLDHSRVLVTKFRQNRSTLKGRNAGQRHTDRHIDTLTDKLGWK